MVLLTNTSIRIINKIKTNVIFENDDFNELIDILYVLHSSIQSKIHKLPIIIFCKIKYSITLNVGNFGLNILHNVTMIIIFNIRPNHR